MANTAAVAAHAAASQSSRPNRLRTAGIDSISSATAGRPPKGVPPAASNDDRPAGKEPLRGIRVLIVEDEFLVAIQLEDTLSALGCEVLEPAHSMDEAEKAVAQHEFDVAVLDINIAGRAIYPIAEILGARGIPFIFTTGYSREHIEEAWREAPTLRKPYLALELRRVLEQALGREPPPEA